MGHCAHVVLLRDVFDKGDDLEGGGGVQTRGRLVQEQELWTGDELGRDTNTTLLTTRDTLPDWRSDEVVGLSLQTECSQESFDALDAFEFADGSW